MKQGDISIEVQWSTDLTAYIFTEKRKHESLTLVLKYNHFSDIMELKKENMIIFAPQKSQS